VEDRTDPEEATYPWYRRTVPLAALALAMVIVLNVIF
jgi:SSS family solute:Na+ symporter